MKKLTNRKRGSTLFEVLIGAGVSAITLTAGVGLFIGTSMNWAKGASSLDSMSNAQSATRFIAQELREACKATISSDGMTVTYEIPTKENGDYKMPIVSDGVSRSISVVSGRLRMQVGSSVRLLATGISSSDPDTNQSYKVFSPGNTGILRKVNIQLATVKAGVRNQVQTSRSRDTVCLRNVVQVTR